MGWAQRSSLWMEPHAPNGKAHSPYVSSPLTAQLGEGAFSIIDRDDITLFDARSKTDDIIVFPHFDEMGFARVNRTRKAHIKSSDTGLVVARHCLQHAAAGNTVRAEAMQNRRIESCFFGNVGVSVQGVAVAAQCINHGLVTSLG